MATDKSLLDVDRDAFYEKMLLMQLVKEFCNNYKGIKFYRI